MERPHGSVLGRPLDCESAEDTISAMEAEASKPSHKWPGVHPKRFKKLGRSAVQVPLCGGEPVKTQAGSFEQTL